MQTNDMLRQSAHWYAKHGYRVFPCRVQEKAPISAHGCRDGTLDIDQINVWWDNGNWNVGVATGNGLVVLDIDIDETKGKRGDETLAAWERQYGALPPTWTALTGGGGKHFWFRCEHDEDLTVGTAVGPGVDYRANGGYVIAPFSIHPSGRLYDWEPGLKPSEVELATLPEWLHALLRDAKRGNTITQVRVSRASERPLGGSGALLSEGNRNAGLFSLASSLRSRGLSDSALLAALEQENQSRCRPPLAPDEVRRIAESVMRYDVGEIRPVTPPKPEGKLAKEIRAADLLAADLPKTVFWVDELLPEGCTLLTAASKGGKSWMVLDMAMAVASGRVFLGHKTTQCGVLYLALEDSEARLQDRMAKILHGKKPPDEFYLMTDAPRMDTGLLKLLGGWLKQHEGVKLIIIDTLQKIRGDPGKGENAYATDYREIGDVKRFCAERGASVILVHHNRKMKDEQDPFNMILGSNALMGAADTIWTLTRKERGSDEATLNVTGRDVVASELAIHFDPMSYTWQLSDTETYTERQKRESYENSEVVRVVKALLEEATQWRGTTGDLIKEAERRGLSIPLTPKTVGWQIKRFEAELLRRDGIIHEPCNRREHLFKRRKEVKVHVAGEAYGEAE